MKLLKYFAPSLAFLFLAGIAYAASVLTVPQGGTGAATFPVKRLIVSNSSKATGTLQTLTPGSDGLFLRSSSTAPQGFDFATASTSGGTGITSLNGLVSATQTFATSSDTNLLLNIVSSGSTHTFNPVWTGTLAAGRLNSNVVQGVTTTTSANIFNAAISAQNLALTLPANLINSIATTSNNSVFFVSTSTTGSTNSLTINFPNNLLTSVTADSPLGGAGTSASHLTCTGCLTANQSITLSGAVTGSGATSIVTSFNAGAFATGTAGNIFNISTSTTGLTINMPTATGVITGQLSATDWLTFNNKLSGAATAGQVAYYSAATTTAGSANFLWDNTAKSLMINTTTPTGASLYVVASTSAQTLPIFAVASTTGSLYFTVTAGGNVGIGTSTPDKKLSVQGDIDIPANGTISSFGAININSGGDGLNVVLAGSNGQTSGSSGGAISGVGGRGNSAGVSAGGLINFSAGNGGAAGGNGGIMEIDAGNAMGAGYAGGSLNAFSGNGTTTGAGGLISILGGNGGLTGKGGSILIQGGVGANASSTSNGSGGFITLKQGKKNGTGATGDIQFQNDSGTPLIILDGSGVFGFNATSSTVSFNIQGAAGSNTIFNIASSTGTSYMSVAPTGTITMGTTTVTNLLTIPNGTNPTVSAAGNIAQDTTQDQLLYGSQPNVLMATSSKTMTIIAPTASEDDDFFITDVPITITKIQCVSRNSNTSSVTFSLPHSTNRASGTANLFSSGQVCNATTTPQSYTTFSDNTLAAGEVLWATTSATTLASTTSITVFFKYDRQ